MNVDGPQRWRDDAAAEKDPGFQAALLEGSRHLQVGDVTSARNALEQALRLRPNNEKARNLLGQTYFRMGMLDAAERVFRALAREYPKEPTLRLNLALVHLKRDRVEDARKELELNYRRSPEHQKTLSYLGLVYARQGDFALARWAFQKAGSTRLALEMEQKLVAKGWPLEPAQLPDASPEESSESPAVVVIPVRPPPPAAEPPDEPTPADLQPLPPLDPPPNTSESSAPIHAQSGPRPVEHPVRVVPQPPPREPAAPSNALAAAAATAVLRAAVAEAGSPRGEDVAQAGAALPQIPPTPNAPVSPASQALPRFLSTVAGETGGESPGGRGVTHAKGATPDWTPSPTADSMVVALTHEAMTGGEWLARRSIPPPARPFAPIAPGLLGLTVDGLVLIRARTLAALLGDVHTEPTHRQRQEEGLGKHLGGDADPLLMCTGSGQVHLDPGTDRVAVLKLDRSEATVLESALFGCSSGLAREDISLTLDLEGPRIPAVRFSGTGVVAVRSQSSVRAVPCQKGVPLRISTEHLLAFEGPLTWVAAPSIAGLENVDMPRAAVLEGQGVVLLRAGTRV